MTPKQKTAIVALYEATFVNTKVEPAPWICSGRVMVALEAEGLVYPLETVERTTYYRLTAKGQLAAQTLLLETEDKT